LSVAQRLDNGRKRLPAQRLGEIDALDARAKDVTARLEFQHHDLPNGCRADGSLVMRGACAAMSGYES
jgi:hypothetical protein